MVLLTPAGRAVMKAERPARLLLPARGLPAGPRSGPRPSRESRAAFAEGGGPLFEALREHRLTLARGQGVPPYVVASDRTLREIAVVMPRTLSDLLGVHGIGHAKAERYGKGLLEVVARFAPGRS
jgi:ATP-dependent DNA helicase RecQ